MHAVEAGRGGNLLLVDGLHELAYHQGHTLDPLDLLLGPDELALQTPAHAHVSVSIV